MKIALVGASGNIGSKVVGELVSRGHTVTAIARHGLADVCPGVPATMKIGESATR